MSLKLDTTTKYVKVQFEGGSQKYSYKCTFDVKEGDFVIVVPRDFPSVAKVVSISYADDKSARKYIAGVVDLADYQALLAEEKAKEKLLAKLEQKRKAFEQIAMCKLMAKEDPEIAELLKQLEG